MEHARVSSNSDEGSANPSRTIPMRPLPHLFELPSSAQTLEQGLAEYFAAHPHLKRDTDLLSPEAPVLSLARCGSCRLRLRYIDAG